MSTQVQFRRGTAAQHASFTGAAGEITVNLTNNSVHVHDGTTAGGYEIATADGGNIADNAVTLALMAHQSQGEILHYVSGGVPTALAVGTSGQELTCNGSGANLSWETSSGKDIYLKYVEGENESQFGWYASSNITDAYAYMSFKVPSYFTSLVTAEILFIPYDTRSSEDYDIYSVNAASGETYNTHTDSDTSSTYSVTQNEHSAIDISSILTTIAANDIVGIGIRNNHSDGSRAIAILGIHLEFT